MHASDFRHRLIRRHLVCGWAGLLVFILMGVVLESLHAFKTPLFLDADNETRRLMWRLAHAHGALLSILQLALSWALSKMGDQAFSTRGSLISRCQIAALVLLPSGFLLGGWGAIDGDPGLGIALVPVGAVFLIVGVILSLIEALKLPLPQDE
jgi:hypothetical protein